MPKEEDKVVVTRVGLLDLVDLLDKGLWLEARHHLVSLAESTEPAKDFSASPRVYQSFMVNLVVDISSRGKAISAAVFWEYVKEPLLEAINFWHDRLDRGAGVQPFVVGPVSPMSYSERRTVVPPDPGEGTTHA